MAQRKTVTSQTIIGEKGISLIGTRCLEMGYLFHPRRVDHGIDGHIDLVDPDSGALLNLVLLVQSKAQNRPFSFETDDEFRYLCDERDLDLWLSGNAPVILIFSHPEQDQAWWVDVHAAFPDATARATRTVIVNKNTQRFDADAAPALLRLGIPRESGLYLRPPPITETLTTNLLPISEFPPHIYLATTSATDYPTAGNLLAGQTVRRSGWILRDGLVLSFSNLREAPLRVLCQGDVEEHDTSEWATSEEREVTNRFADLLSRTMQDCYPDLRWHKEREHLHFRPTPGLKPRKVGKARGTPGRTVFGPHFMKSDPERVGYYHHAALRTRIRRIADTWYCQLEPDYCFTSDGYTESRYADSLLTGIKKLDRHAAVASWTKMWARYLRGEDDLFNSDRQLRFGDLLTVTVDRGIDDKWWGAAPVEAAPDDEPGDSPSDRAAAADLAAAGIDTDDLFTLFTDPELQPQPDAPSHGAGDPKAKHQRRTGRPRQASRRRGQE